MKRVFLSLNNPLNYEWDSFQQIFTTEPTDCEVSHTKEDLIDAVKFIAENEEYEGCNPYLDIVFYEDLQDVDNWNGSFFHHGD